MSGLSCFNCEIAPDQLIDDELMCPICMELINEPVSIDCGHSACKTCLEELIRKSTHPTKCPSCRNFLKPGPLNVNIAIRAAISGISVRCTNAGCTWIGKQGEKVRHRDTCPKMLMPCPNDCTVQFCREEEGQHLTACLYEKVHCASCKAGVPRLYMDIHLQNCPDALWNCPLQCGEHLPRSHIHLHLDECPKRVVKCLVKGCSNFFPLGAEKDHSKLYQESHQVLLKQEVERLKSILFNKDTEMVEQIIKARKSFRWTLTRQELTNNGKEPATKFFNIEGSSFRCIWLRGRKEMLLQQVVSSQPLTVKPRYAVIKDGEVEKVFESRYPEIVSEINSVSTKVDFGQLTNEQELVIKITIAIYRHS